MGRVLALSAFGLWLVGCGEADRTQRELVDDGQVCLQLRADGRIGVSVQYHACLRSCDVAKPGSCSVTGDGTSLRVSSHGELETLEGETCSATCGRFGVSCESESTFAPGTYSLTHGDDTALVVLGSQAQCWFAE